MNLIANIEAEIWRRLAGVTLAALAAFSSSCDNSRIEPVAIAPEDMCSFCRMAITEKRYAAEIITGDGDVFKFDDIGCMVGYKNESVKDNQVVARFVADFDSRVWLEAGEAHYVKSLELKTPMGFGIAAFKDESRAREAAATYRGSVARLEELINPAD